MQLPQSNTSDKNDKEKPNELAHVVSDQVFSETVNSVVNGTMSSSVQEPDFSEFMWMANEDLEAFDRKVISELDEHLGFDSRRVLVDDEEEEEEFLQLMLEEEEERDTVYFASQATLAPDGSVRELSNRMHRMGVADGIAAQVAQSTLNPFAAEFIPSQGIQNTNFVAPTISMMSQANSCAMVSQMYASSIGAPIHGNGINNITQSLSPAVQAQNIIWRQNTPQMSPRYNGPVHAQINGQDALRRLYGNAPPMPMYVSNVPVYPMVNGGHFIQPPQNRYRHPESDRCTEDEGYEDN